jgi:hypothetical protein
MNTQKKSQSAGWKICAASADYSEKAFILYYGEGQSEYLPKSRCKFIMNYFGDTEFGDGKAARWYAVPAWLMSRLRGKQFYKITK